MLTLKRWSVLFCLCLMLTACAVPALDTFQIPLVRGEDVAGSDSEAPVAEAAAEADRQSENADRDEDELGTEVEAEDQAAANAALTETPDSDEVASDLPVVTAPQDSPEEPGDEASTSSQTEASSASPPVTSTVVITTATVESASGSPASTTVLTGTMDTPATGTARDVTRPNLADLRISPINLVFDESTLQINGQYCCITVTAQLMDDLAGVSDAEFWFYVPERPEKRHLVYFSEQNRTFGDAVDGTYSETISATPPYADAGPWSLLSVRVRDRAGNVSYWTGDDLTQFDFPQTYSLGLNNLFMPVVENSDPPSLSTVNANANLREGPGTHTQVIGTVRRGEQIQLQARNQDGSWYQLVDGRWIAAFLVDDVPADLPIK